MIGISTYCYFDIYDSQLKTVFSVRFLRCLHKISPDEFCSCQNLALAKRFRSDDRTLNQSTAVNLAAHAQIESKKFAGPLVL